MTIQQQMITRSKLCLLGLLGLTLFTSPVAAQIFDPGPSDSALFDTVLNLPGDEAIITGADNETIGGIAGQTTQLNVDTGGTVGDEARAIDSEVNITGGTVGRMFVAQSSEVNISDGFVGFLFQATQGSVVNLSGGSISELFVANSGSEVNISGGNVSCAFEVSNSVVNISGGTVGFGFLAESDSVVNISGGSIETFTASSRFFPSNVVVNISGGTFGGPTFGGGFNDAFVANSGSEVNVSGSEFFIDGVELDTLQLDQAFTITDRDVTLSGLLADGEPFSFDLNSVLSSGSDFFDPTVAVTVTLVAPTIILGDVNQDGEVNSLDINPFISILAAANFLEQADCNQDGVVNFLDIAPFIAILSGN